MGARFGKGSPNEAACVSACLSACLYVCLCLFHASFFCLSVSGRQGGRASVCVCFCVLVCVVAWLVVCLLVCVFVCVCLFVGLFVWFFGYSVIGLGPCLQLVCLIGWLLCLCVCLLVFVSVSYCMSVWLPPQAGPHTQGHLHIGLGRCRIPGGGDGFPCGLGRHTGSQLMRSSMRATTQKL